VEVVGGTLQPSLMAIIAAFSTAFLFNNGNEPGNPTQIGEMFVFGSNPR